MTNASQSGQPPRTGPEGERRRAAGASSVFEVKSSPSSGDAAGGAGGSGGGGGGGGGAGVRTAACGEQNGSSALAASAGVAKRSWGFLAIRRSRNSCNPGGAAT